MEELWCFVACARSLGNVVQHLLCLKLAGEELKTSKAAPQCPISIPADCYLHRKAALAEVPGITGQGESDP